MTIAEAHDAAACPGCQTGFACRVVTLGHVRLWLNYRRDPARWGAVLAREAIADRRPLDTPPPPPRPLSDAASVTPVPSPPLPRGGGENARADAEDAEDAAAVSACPDLCRELCRSAVCRRPDRPHRVTRALCRACRSDARRPRSVARELVVARHRERLDWLADVPPIIDRITVVSNGGDLPAIPPEAAPRTMIRQSQPWGREAYAFADFICRSYWSIAELTFFAQADPFEHAPDFLLRLTLRYDRPTGLTTRYRADWPSDQIKSRDRVELHYGVEVRYGDARIQVHPDQPAWFNDAAWSYLFDAPLPESVWFAYGAMYAVPRAAILARQWSAWDRLRAEIRRAGYRDGRSVTDPPLNPWALEALWGYVWGGVPFSTRFR